jgi:hypothetical protein
VYRLDMVPLRRTSSGNGHFRLQVTNTGTADGQLEFAGRDADDLCHFHFPKGNHAASAAASRTEIPVLVQPKSKPWVGPERAYLFSVTGTPVDGCGEPRTVTGQYTHRPRAV